MILALALLLFAALAEGQVAGCPDFLECSNFTVTCAPGRCVCRPWFFGESFSTAKCLFLKRGKKKKKKKKKKKNRQPVQEPFLRGAC